MGELRADVAIIGGGIVGVSTAYALSKQAPDCSLVLLEKEQSLGQHQTGHNSGVIHSGLYYRPGSLKAENCGRGRQKLEQFCEEHGVPFERCGKVVVACDKDEIEPLRNLYTRGQKNGVRCRLVTKEELQEVEPYAAGVEGMIVEDTGVVDYLEVLLKLSNLLVKAGHRIELGAEVKGVRSANSEIVVETTQGEVTCRKLVNCGGLYADRIAKSAGVQGKTRIVPFRGEYFDLKPEARKYCRSLIYPVPDPRFPFLGVHITRSIDGRVDCGPSAVLALSREGYQKRDICIRDAVETLFTPSSIRLFSKYYRMGIEEMYRSFSKRAFHRAVERLVPAIELDDLVPAPAGVRAQALSEDGRLLDDFVLEEHRSGVHVLNAPSPAATACLSIGETIAAKLLAQLEEGSP